MPGILAWLRQAVTGISGLRRGGNPTVGEGVKVTYTTVRHGRAIARFGINL